MKWVMLCMICLLVMVSGCAGVTLEDMQQHIDHYYQLVHRTESEKKKLVKRGSIEVGMTLTEIKLATSVAEINEGCPLWHWRIGLCIDKHGCWSCGDVSSKAGGFLWLTVNRYDGGTRYDHDYGRPWYTCYFKWNDGLGEYVCYDWVQW